MSGVKIDHQLNPQSRVMVKGCRYYRDIPVLTREQRGDRPGRQQRDQVERFAV